MARIIDSSLWTPIWELIAHQRIIPWFDSVDSASFPELDCLGDGVCPGVLWK